MVLLIPAWKPFIIKNAARLGELIAQHGWPAEDLAGPDGAEAAWLIAQHSIGEPEFMRTALRLVQVCAEQGRVPAWHAAYLEDRFSNGGSIGSLRAAGVASESRPWLQFCPSGQVVPHISKP